MATLHGTANCPSDRVALPNGECGCRAGYYLKDGQQCAESLMLYQLQVSGLELERSRLREHGGQRDFEPVQRWLALVFHHWERAKCLERKTGK